MSIKQQYQYQLYRTAFICFIIYHIQIGIVFSWSKFMARKIKHNFQWHHVVYSISYIKQTPESTLKFLYLHMIKKIIPNNINNHISPYWCSQMHWVPSYPSPPKYRNQRQEDIAHAQLSQIPPERKCLWLVRMALFPWPNP